MAKLRYVIVRAHYLGSQPPKGYEGDAVDVAVWAPPPYGRGYGYYACFRVFRDADTPLAAMLFCFYDGRDRSPGFKSRSAAQAFAAQEGFTTHDGDD